MPSRDAALDALNNRLAAATADPGLPLTDDALRDAAELAAATDTATDLPAAQALGWFHWNRNLFLGNRDGHSDQMTAIRYFILVYQASPASVPAPIQQTIHDLRQDGSPAAGGRIRLRLAERWPWAGEIAATVARLWALPAS